MDSSDSAHSPAAAGDDRPTFAQLRRGPGDPTHRKVGDM